MSFKNIKPDQYMTYAIMSIFLIPIMIVIILNIKLLIKPMKKPPVNIIDQKKTQDDSDESFFSPPYTLKYPAKYIDGCKNVERNINQYNNNKWIKLHIDDCPCVPIAKHASAQRISMLCIADWLSNPGDLWLISKEKTSTDWSKPIFTGITMSDLYPESERESIIGNMKLKIERQALFVTKRAISITTKFQDIEEEHQYIAQTIALMQDSDNDGLTDLAERRIGTSITLRDTDHDGILDPNDTNPTVSYEKNCKDSDLYSAVFNHMEKYLVGPVSIIGFADKVFPESRIVDSSCTIKKSNALVLRSPGKGMIHYGVILFEKPVFDENGNASLTALFNCGALCGNVTQYSLKKNSNKWEVQDGKLQIIF